MKRTWHLSSLVVLAGALQAQTPSPAPESSDPAAPNATQQVAPPAGTATTEAPATQAAAAAPVASQPASTPTAPSAPAATATSPAPAAPSTAAPANAAAPASAPATASPSNNAAPAVAPAATPATPSPANSATPASPSPAAKPAAQTSPAPAAKPAASAPSAAPKAASSAPANGSSKPTTDAPKSGAQADEKSKEGGEGGGFAFHPGLAFGTVTMNGQTWTRLTLQPEISIGKLGIAFDLEVFLDEKQEFSARGWEFDTKEKALESVLRKIYYVRWDKPGAPFYARLGALEGISLGYGLVGSNYGNVSRYPDYKLLGLHTQLNDISGLGLDAEVVVNSLQDIQNGGPFTAAKVGLRPFKPMGLPIFKNLALRVGVARDWNQYAGLRDQDGDGCPDAIDYDVESKKVCYEPLLSRKDAGIPSSWYATADSLDKLKSDSVRSSFSIDKPFSIYWAEAGLPLIQTKFFGLELYSVFAVPQTEDDSAVDRGWGSIPLGAGSYIGPVTINAEYRAIKAPFLPGHFNAMYEVDRARFIQKKPTTKELDVYGKDVAGSGMLQGYYVNAGWDLWGFLKLGGSYSQLFSSDDSTPDLKTMSGSVGIGPKVTQLVKKLSLAEVYWQKDRIGQDSWTDINGNFRHEGFFQNSIYTVYGYRVGSEAAPGLMIVMDRQTSFTRQTDGKLKQNTQMKIESQFKF